jgi:hypothetical protein
MALAEQKGLERRGSIVPLLEIHARHSVQPARSQPTGWKDGSNLLVTPIVCLREDISVNDSVRSGGRDTSILGGDR